MAMYRDDDMRTVRRSRRGWTAVLAALSLWLTVGCAQQNLRPQVSCSMPVPAQIQGCDTPTAAPQAYTQAPAPAPAPAPPRAQVSTAVPRESKTIFGMETAAMLPPQYLPLLGRTAKSDWGGRSAPAWVWDDLRDHRDVYKSTKIPPPRVATRNRGRIPMMNRGQETNTTDAFTAANIPPPRPLNLPPGLGTNAINPPGALPGEKLPPLPPGMTQ
ncbi:hypothetical protein ACYOEI_22470 [Singulisphaera rosea]